MLIMPSPLYLEESCYSDFQNSAADMQEINAVAAQARVHIRKQSSYRSLKPPASYVPSRTLNLCVHLT